MLYLHNTFSIGKSTPVAIVTKYKHGKFEGLKERF